MLYFALREGLRPSQIESSNLGMVLLQVTGSWLRSKLGGQSHEEAAKADHMGDSRGSFTMNFYFIYYSVEMYLWVMLRNKVILLAGEHSLPWPISCSISESGLPVCMFSGALFRYWNLLSD